MIRKCLLETDGYQIAFDFKGWATQQEVDMVVTFMGGPPLCPRFSATSVPTFISLSDLRRLRHYFFSHIAQLQQNPDRESYPFVPLGLGFQVQALGGDVRLSNEAAVGSQEGEFTIRFMVNVGRSHDENAAVYVGGETAVTVANINHFLVSLELALTSLSRGNNGNKASQMDWQAYQPAAQPTSRQIVTA